MLPRLLEQAAILVAAAVLLGLPGTALVSLLRIRAALPDALAVPAGALLGVLVACAATAVQLAFEIRWHWAVGIHLCSSLLLAAAAMLVLRRRRNAGTRVVPERRGWGWATTGVLVVAALFAWIVRGSVRLDTLYHVSVSRKLTGLAHPSFDNVNRFADGGPNPAYALPGWHAFVGWCAELTGADPILAWEILPVLVVVLAALAAGGLALVLLRAPLALPLGAGVWVVLRELYARREVDGDAIAFGAVPGQLVFELALPVLLGAIAVAWFDGLHARRWRAAMVVAVSCVVVIVVLHANYVLYVGMVGAGAVAWASAVDRRDRASMLHALRTWGVVAVACVVCLGVLLPLLAQLENFGNAPEDARIDYHLTSTAGLTHIRGGHLYEMFTMPGLLAVLLAPVVALRWRAPGTSLVAGGLLAIGAFSFLPPLYALVAATGSLTVGLRANHVAGVLLGPVLVAAILMVAGHVRVARGRRATQALAAASVVLVLSAVGVLVGYERFLPDLPGYLGWGGLLAAFVWSAFRSRGERAGVRTPVVVPRGVVVVAVSAVLLVGLGFPVGLVSMRRAVAQAAPLTAGTAAGDLECIDGFVADQLARIPPGSVVLSDPRTSFLAMAVAPIYVVGDYKVWNAATKDNRTAERLAQVNRFFDTSADPLSRLEVLRDQEVDYLLVDMRDPRWLETYRAGGTKLPRAAELERALRALDTFADTQSYDGRGVAQLASAFPQVFGEPTVDPRGRANAVPPRRPDDPVACNAFALWELPRITRLTSTGAIPQRAADKVVLSIEPGSVVRQRIGVELEER